MINIGIFTYARTGSNWLGNMFRNEDSIYYEEIFCSNYIEYFRKILPVLKLHNIPINIIDTFLKIYASENITTYIDIEKLKKDLDAQHIYNINLLHTLINESQKQNKNCIFKIFDEHFRYDITLESINKCIDYSIINYRQNVLHSYISFNKAFHTQQWTLSKDQEKKDFNYFIHIDINSFMQYKKQIISFLQTAYKNLDNPIIIDYESIHSHTDIDSKYNYVYDTLKSGGLNFDLSSTEIFQKQNDNLLSHVSNYDDIKELIKHKKHLISLIDITNAS